MLGAGFAIRSIKVVVANRETVTVDGQTSARDAARLMAERAIGAVPVIEGDRLVGIFTERDVMSRIVAAGRDPVATSVADVMSTDLVVASVEESYETCLSRMQQARVRHLIVLDKGRLAGIVSLRDLLAVDIDEKAEAISLLNGYIHYIPADLHATKKST
jgi:CBS domain-containing protein